METLATTSESDPRALSGPRSCVVGRGRRRWVGRRWIGRRLAQLHHITLTCGDPLERIKVKLRQEELHQCGVLGAPPAPVAHAKKGPQLDNVTFGTAGGAAP